MSGLVTLISCKVPHIIFVDGCLCRPQLATILWIWWVGGTRHAWIFPSTTCWPELKSEETDPLLSRSNLNCKFLFLPVPPPSRIALHSCKGTVWTMQSDSRQVVQVRGIYGGQRVGVAKLTEDALFRQVSLFGIWRPCNACQASLSTSHGNDGSENGHTSSKCWLLRILCVLCSDQTNKEIRAGAYDMTVLSKSVLHLNIKQNTNNKQAASRSVWQMKKRSLKTPSPSSLTHLFLTLFPPLSPLGQPQEPFQIPASPSSSSQRHGQQTSPSLPSTHTKDNSPSRTSPFKQGLSPLKMPKPMKLWDKRWWTMRKQGLMHLKAG